MIISVELPWQVSGGGGVDIMNSHFHPEGGVRTGRPGQDGRQVDKYFLGHFPHWHFLPPSLP